MSKKTHQRELDRARAKRQAAAYQRRQQRVRMISMFVILAMAGAVLASVALSGGDTPQPEIDGFDSGQTAGSTLTSPEPVAADACPAPVNAPASPQKTYDAPPEMTIDPAKSYTATVETSCGTIVLELDAANAPATVNNFVFLANDGYYVGAPFHRIIEDFMIQGGDPSGTGHGDGGTFPGYTFEDELELAQQVVGGAGGYPRGTVAMANSGPDTNGSQFFIMQVQSQPAYPLPANYAVFGRVIAGMDVVDEIVAGPKAGDQATSPVVILSIEITEA